MDNEHGTQALIWQGRVLSLLDQRLLPHRVEYIECRRTEDICRAIIDMVVRGAPAIGICAAYGAVLAYYECQDLSVLERESRLLNKLEHIAAARPTAVNLVWAVNQVRQCIASQSWAGLVGALPRLAEDIHQADIDANRKMGALACEHFALAGSGKFSILTHCNTGSLATGGYGTALGAIQSAWHVGILRHVYVDETRPWLQGARLTAWELQQAGIPFSLNADSAAAWLMQSSDIAWVVVGADRITANGDVANKIGTYALAILARYHGAKLMVVAPTSTIDMALVSGADIDIETRSAQELTHIAGQNVAPENSEVSNPVFDVTPASLIDVLVTEKGSVVAPDQASLSALFA